MPSCGFFGSKNIADEYEISRVRVATFGTDIDDYWFIMEILGKEKADWFRGLNRKEQKDILFCAIEQAKGILDE